MKYHPCTELVLMRNLENINPIKEIQEENTCKGNIQGLSGPDDSDNDEAKIAD